MTMAADIDTRVAMRDGLRLAIRPTLLKEAETDWSAHPRFARKARFFMTIYRQLLDGANWLAATYDRLLDASRLQSAAVSRPRASILYGLHRHMR